MTALGVQVSNARVIRALVAATILCAPATFAHEKTVIEDKAMADKLLGEHVFNLQWIDTPPGTAKVEDKGGVLLLTADQRAEVKGNYATIKGVITHVSAKTFTVDGEIITRVDYVAEGRKCARRGKWTFRITGKRKYWRLKEMENPCEGGGTVDYLDIYIAQKPR